MKRLMLDYFRRWSWVLAVVGVLQFTYGEFIANHPERDSEIWGWFLASLMGANLLAHDLRRGVVRAVAVLPLTARQIGRSWWLATIAIPAIASAALLFLGAGTSCHFHPNQGFPAGRLAMASLFTLVWLGATFTVFFPTPGLYLNMREFGRTGCLGVLAVMTLFGGMLLVHGASRKPVGCVLFLGVGAFLTVSSWFRAEGFVLSRAGFRLAAVRFKDPRGQYHAPVGGGGIPFLVRTTAVRMVLYLAVMSASVLLLLLLMQCLGREMSGPAALVVFVGMSPIYVFVLLIELLPVVRQLRFLRTLPISATRLAAVMIAIMILPLFAVGALVAGGAGLTLGFRDGFMLLKTFTFILGPASLGVFFTVWRGEGMQAYALLALTLFGFLMLHLSMGLFMVRAGLAFGPLSAIVALSVLLAFVLTRSVLEHGSRAYRVPATPFGSFAWGPDS